MRDGEYLFVEIKRNSDGLKGSQFKWLRQNMNVNYCVLIVDD